MIGDDNYKEPLIRDTFSFEPDESKTPFAEEQKIMLLRPRENEPTVEMHDFSTGA